MRFAHRTKTVVPFQAMEFAKQAVALEVRGHHVIKLNIGEPDFGAPPAVIEAIQRSLTAEFTTYTPALGITALREAIAAHYAAQGVAVDASRVVVTAGASAALLLTCAALVNEGDDVLVGDPSYPCNRHFLAAFGAQVRLVPTQARTRFQLDAAAVADHWRSNTRGLMIATPSNPTGTAVPTDELAAICQHVAAHDGWRIVDEIYLSISYPADRPAPPSVLAVDDGAVVINSFSKTFGMTGWRLGWAVVPPAMVGVMERLAQNYFICPSAPAQHAALACFTPDTLALMQQRRERFGLRRDLVLAGLQRIGLPVPVTPDGSFYVYIDISGTGLDAMTFCRRLLAEAHVALTPGMDFGVCSGDQHVRLSYAASEDDLTEALVRIGRFVGTLRG